MVAIIYKLKYSAKGLFYTLVIKFNSIENGTLKNKFVIYTSKHAICK